MATSLRLECLLFDTRELTAGQTELTFFTEGPDHGPLDDTARSESQLVAWLFEEPRRRSLICRSIGLPSPASLGLFLKSPFLTSPDEKPGDIDVLLCPSGEPHRAVVLECKRVRVRAGTEGQQRVNRLDNLASAPLQVNALAGKGFYRTYLTVIAIVHDLSDPSLNFTARGTSDATLTRVLTIAQELPLAHDVGILYIEINQPAARSLDTTALVGAAPPRNARPHEQSADTTALVSNYFTHHGEAPN